MPEPVDVGLLLVALLCAHAPLVTAPNYLMHIPNLQQPHRPMPFEDAKQCTATAKSTGERCQNPAVKGWDVCRVHGAGTPKENATGGAPPKHGRYAAKQSESLQEKIRKYREDPKPVEMWEELALLRAVLQEWLDDLDTVDEDTVGVILDLQNSIRRTLNTINKIRTRTALTAAETQFLQARIADLFETYVPFEKRSEALDELREITGSTNGKRRQ